MRVVHKRCAGLDVHQKSITGCVEAEGGARDARVFGTATSELLKMEDWLGQSGCTIVAMEATAVYWKPVWQVLEDHFELVLARMRLWASKSAIQKASLISLLRPCMFLTWAGCAKASFRQHRSRNCESRPERESSSFEKSLGMTLPRKSGRVDYLA